MHILIVDDDSLDREHLRRSLEKTSITAKVDEAASAEEALWLMAVRDVDCVLTDHRLPDMSGIDLISKARSRHGDGPAMVLLSGLADEMVVARALKSGADDYLPKDAITPDSIYRIVRSATELAKLRRSKKAMEHDRASERALLRKAERMSGSGSWEYCGTEHNTTWSDGLYAVTGQKHELFTPKAGSFRDFLESDFRDEYAGLADRLHKQGKPFDIHHWIRRKDGQRRFVRHAAQPTFDEMGRIRGAIGIVQDQTDQKRAEEALERAERTEAIAALAGGLAHDFNNLLGIIVGNVGLLRRSVAEDPRSLKKVDLVERAARRGSALIQKLLNFSHHEPNQGEPTLINDVLEGMDDLLSETIPDGVDLKIYPSQDLWLTDIIPGDLEDAVLNLVINARDAMAEGGTIILETINTRTDRLPASFRKAEATTDYVVVSISDTGHGMTKEIRDRVLDPFFTTKGKTKGSGLGLSMVYGFVRRSGGDIRIYSEPGKGTTIQLFLPRSGSDERPVAQESLTDTHHRLAHHRLQHQQATILAVDDEADLLEVVAEIIEDLGHIPLRASCAEQALKILETTDRVDMVLSDTIMPGMNGLELGCAIQDRWPGIPVVLTSGYSGKLAETFGDEPLLRSVLPKPFSSADLDRRIREGLGDSDRTEANSGEPDPDLPNPVQPNPVPVARSHEEGMVAQRGAA